MALAGGAAAQRAGTTPLQPGETAMEFAERINACNDAEIVSAAFNEARTEVRVQCPQVAGSGQATAGMTGGLGTTGAMAIGIAVAAGLAAAAGSGGGGSSSTTTTN